LISFATQDVTILEVFIIYSDLEKGNEKGEIQLGWKNDCLST